MKAERGGEEKYTVWSVPRNSSRTFLDQNGEVLVAVVFPSMKSEA